MKQYNQHFTNKFSEQIFKQKYAIHPDETWDECAKRVADTVYPEIYPYLVDKKFVPGGRYLYSCGREFYQYNNCFCFGGKTINNIEFDSREGWAELLYQASLCFMTGGGVGISYSEIRGEGFPLKKTGGYASGPISLMAIVNETGRHIAMGGSRRAAGYAGLRWNHPDINKFLVLKNRSPEEVRLKEKNFNYPLPFDNTNISVEYDTNFFDRYDNNDPIAKEVFYKNCKQAFQTAEPGFCFNYNRNDILRNPCQPGDATVFTKEGIKYYKDLQVGMDVWNGDKWVKIKKIFNNGIKSVYKYHTPQGYFYGTPNHKVLTTNGKIEVGLASHIISTQCNISINNLDPQDIMDGLVFGDGSVHKASNNLVHLYVGKKDIPCYLNSEIAHLIIKERPNLSKSAMCYEIETTINYLELPKTFERVIPDRFYFGSPTKVAGFLRGLYSANGCNIDGRIQLKTSCKKQAEQVQEMLGFLGIKSCLTTNKGKNTLFNNGLYYCKDSYNIIIYNHNDIFLNKIGFLHTYKTQKGFINKIEKTKASKILSVEYIKDDFVFDIEVDDDSHTYTTNNLVVSNCAEFTSDTSGDTCNLGTIFISKINTKEEFKEVVWHAVAFLLQGKIKTILPTELTTQIGRENNRIGLGIGGIAEWLMLRGYHYEVVPELHEWLQIYQNESVKAAEFYSKLFNVNMPKALRAIAPNGTIGLIAETTTGIEPLFAKAYKRRFLSENQKWVYSYVVDAAVYRLREQGIKDENIFDAYDINFEQRIKFQADVQDYIDMSISSTCNIPYIITDEGVIQAYAEILYKYAKRLRGFTCYPDGCRGGQPLTVVSLEKAEKHKDKIIIEEVERPSCASGVCGI